MRSLFRPISTTVIALSYLLLSACSSLNNQPPANTTSEPIAAQPEQEPENTTDAQGSFDASTLYSLLVAELASQRGMGKVALHNYLREAERTRDVQIARHATQLAAQYRQPDSRLKAAQLWAELEPDNPEPNNIAAAELIRRGQTEQALPLLEKALEQDSLTTIDSLAERTQRMSSEERDNYLQLLDQHLLLSPDKPKLLYAKASLLRFEEDLEPALNLVQQALDNAPDFDRAILLEADLQARSGHMDTALGHLREALNEGDHKQMRTLYIRLLLQKGQFDTAQQQAAILMQNHRQDHNLKFYLGALMLEHNQIETSESYFNQLKQQFGTNSTLHYYLGRIAQIKQLRDEALSHYQQIGDSPYLMAGLSEVGKLLDQPADEDQLRQIYRNSRNKHPTQSATLYALEADWLNNQGRIEQALEVYSDALDQHPNDTRLLYNRAMLSEQLQQLEQMEADLGKLLELEPDNATALNALGYSLTVHTERYQEALELIRKALKLKPEDPAILDSMGWVYFKLQDYKLALQYLLRAYQSFPDPEIASHLGQTYWQLGQTTEARRVWDEALERNPDSPLILKAMRQAGLIE